MRKDALRTAAAWATGTCALALAMFLPGSLQADNPLPAIPQPVMHVQGTELSLRMENADSDASGVVRIAGDTTPTLLLVARNPTDKEIELHPVIEVMTSSPADRMSRAPSLPKSIWRRETSLTLAPGKEQIARVRLDTLLPSGKSYTARIEAKPLAINALTFAIKPSQLPEVVAQPPFTLSQFLAAP